MNINSKNISVLRESHGSTVIEPTKYSEDGVSITIEEEHILIEILASNTSNEEYSLLSSAEEINFSTYKEGKVFLVCMQVVNKQSSRYFSVPLIGHLVDCSKFKIDVTKPVNVAVTVIDTDSMLIKCIHQVEMEVNVMLSIYEEIRETSFGEITEEDIADIKKEIAETYSKFTDKDLYEMGYASEPSDNNKSILEVLEFAYKDSKELEPYMSDMKYIECATEKKSSIRKRE